MKRKTHEYTTIDYWPSFNDVLLLAILVLIFVVTVFIITQTGLTEALGTKESALEKLAAQLTRLEEQLDLSREEAASLGSDLNRARKDLDTVFSRYIDEQKHRKATEEASQKQQQELAALSTSMDLFSSQIEALTGQLDQTTEENLSRKEELGRTLDRLSATTETLSQKEKQVAALQDFGKQQGAALGVRQEQIAKLSEAIASYLKHIETLSQQLSAVKQNVDTKDAALSDLNASVKTFSEQVAQLSAQLGKARGEAESQKLEMGKLLDELDKRDKEIVKLRQFEKYRSEFLARLSDVFAGVPNIRVVGDRFVFQGEVLFDPGNADLTDAGRAELRKFADTYHALEGKIPKDVNLNIQIQGHTDTDPIVSAPFASNWELSSARATRVVRFLSVCGIQENRLSSAGFSQYYPAVADDTPEAKRQNRRIEILITQR